MHKMRKIILIVLIVFLLVFIAQKTVNFYVEKQLNSYFSAFGVTAKLEKLQRLTLQYKSLSLACKIKTEDKVIHLVPEKKNFLTKLISLKIPLQTLLPFHG